MTWKPMVKANLANKPENRKKNEKLALRIMKERSVSLGEALDYIDELQERLELYMNDKYQAGIEKIDSPEGWPELWHMSLRRNDREPLHDWRDIQRVKNDIFGPESEAVELYPAESRLVDSVNQYHLFVLKNAKWPFGFNSRFLRGPLSEEEDDGTKQRPFA